MVESRIFGSMNMEDGLHLDHARPKEGSERPYAKEDVERLRGSVKIEYTLAKLGARRLWDLLTTEDYVQALGALTGTQAVQMVTAD